MRVGGRIGLGSPLRRRMDLDVELVGDGDPELWALAEGRESTAMPRCRSIAGRAGVLSSYRERATGPTLVTSVADPAARDVKLSRATSGHSYRSGPSWSISRARSRLVWRAVWRSMRVSNSCLRASHSVRRSRGMRDAQ